MMELNENILKELEGKKFKIIYVSDVKGSRLDIKILKEDWRKSKFYEYKELVVSRLIPYLREKGVIKETEAIDILTMFDRTDYIGLWCEVFSVSVIAEI